MSNTGWTSVGERLMTLSTSPVAVWYSKASVSCSRASVSSRVRAATCSWRSVVDTRAVDALRARPVVCRPSTGRPLPLVRCMSPPKAGSRPCSILGKSSISRHARTPALPPKADLCGATRDVRFGPEADIHVTPFLHSPRHVVIYCARYWSAWTDYSGATLVDREQENIMNIIEKSRETVEQLLARRNLPKTYEEKCQYALDLVDMHLHEKTLTASMNASSFIPRMPSGKRRLATLAIEGGRRSRTCICACSTPRRGSPFIRSSASQHPTASSTTCGRRFASRAMALRIARSLLAPR